MTRARDIADQQDNLGGAVAPVVSGKNAIINGGFDIWQRGTSFTALGVYTADRWYYSNFTSTGRTITRQLTNDSVNLPNIQYCLRAQRDSGNALTGTIAISQSLETVNSIPFAGKTITGSFYARRGANFSSSSNLLSVAIVSGTGTDQNQQVGYTGTVNVAGGDVALTTTWQRFTFTGTVPTTATELAFVLYYAPTGTAGANDYFEITGVQLELGSVATPFSRAGGSIGGELSLCERYYQILTGAMCSGSNSTTVYSGLNFRTQMRTAPTVALSAAMVITDAGADYTQSSANIGIVANRANSFGAQITMANFSSITTHRPYSTTITASQIQLSAEL